MERVFREAETSTREASTTFIGFTTSAVVTLLRSGGERSRQERHPGPGMLGASQCHRQDGIPGICMFSCLSQPLAIRLVRVAGALFCCSHTINC